jgi:hypothetical protein
MNKNVGTIDRILRAGLALVFAVLIVTQTVGGVLAWILGILAATLLVTSAVSICPLYAPLRINTRGDHSTKL